MIEHAAMSWLVNALWLVPLIAGDDRALRAASRGWGRARRHARMDDGSGSRGELAGAAGRAPAVRRDAGRPADFAGRSAPI